MQLRRQQSRVLTDHGVQVFLGICSAHLPSLVRIVFTDYGV
ncbi:hypothetical protein ROS217_01920 [Roseovarius sp. 217]|nr:hypothetical protein ROS217_01920 [Roseovarius sp. 217]